MEDKELRKQVKELTEVVGNLLVLTQRTIEISTMHLLLFEKHLNQELEIDNQRKSANNDAQQKRKSDTPITREEYENQQNCIQCPKCKGRIECNDNYCSYCGLRLK